MCALSFAALWLVFIRLEAGRRFGDGAWAGREVLSDSSRVLTDRALRTITNSTLLVGCVALVVVGVVRRRALLGLAAAASVAAATVSAEILKRVVIERPLTPGGLPSIAGNSFPSGHATICTSLALAALMVTPHRWRRVVGFAAVLWVTFQATGVLAAGWHRPSDALGGLVLANMVIDMVGIAVVWWFWRLLRDGALDPPERSTMLASTRSTDEARSH